VSFWARDPGAAHSFQEIPAPGTRHPAPVIHPSKIVCVGRNYRDHAKELGNEVPKDPLIFLKPPSSLVGEGDAIVLPPVSSQVEYEGEIGILIDRRIRNASPEEAIAAIHGVVAVNDVTARDLQKSDGQWTRAKGFDSFCPVGQVAGSVSDLSNLVVVTRVNGQERQRGRSADMVFDIPFLLSWISRVMTLEQGDLVATGTPAGVGTLSPGDVVEVEIAGVAGVLSSVRNPVTAER
jgi:2-keto-4-pentenoate hydratase/2-oxohepta-3-ene-1,7-dioic acid hydratase in catechol pathway